MIAISLLLRVSMMLWQCTKALDFQLSHCQTGLHHSLTNLLLSWKDSNGFTCGLMLMCQDVLAPKNSQRSWIKVK